VDVGVNRHARPLHSSYRSHVPPPEERPDKSTPGAPSLRWINTTPDQDDAVKFAHKRRANEARAERNARSKRRRLCQLASGQNATAVAI
jgi:hypothetical protein